MPKVILICGKICSGKTWYAKKLQQQNPAVILSTDEATFHLIHNEQGEFYNAFAQRVNGYLRIKAVDIIKAGANVILDWGFWTKQDREAISRFLEENGVAWEWHYVDVPGDVWQKNIERRNTAVLAGEGGSDFYVDEGLRNKVLSLFQIPSREEMDVWYTPERE